MPQPEGADIDAAHLIAFNLALLAAWAAPGPALLYALRTSLAAGRAAGMAAGAGLGLVASLWTLAALLGLETLFTLFPWAYTILKTGGALYLLWIAWATWRAARAPLESDVAGARRIGRATLGGMILNLSNPKSVLFAAAVLVVIFPPDLAPGAMALVTANHLLLECVLYGTLAAAVSTPAVSRTYLGFKPHLDRAAALVMGALGLRLLIDR